MKWLVLITLCLTANPVLSETVVPSRTIRANAIITETDVKLAAVEMPSGYSRLSDVVGQESRVVLYAGRPILFDDIGPPAIITRNQIVEVRYMASGLSITAEGRALERGAIGDRIRVMNLVSRTTIFGQVLEDGSIRVRK